MRFRGWASVVCVGVGLGLAACDRGSPPPARGPAAPVPDIVRLPPEKPTYTIAPGLTERHPEVAGFMRHFLEMCLTGDYAGYRRLVSERVDPESRARFEKVLNALRHLDVEEVEAVKLAQLPGAVYRVIARAEFVSDEARVPRRAAGPRRIAILVVQESGEWRMTIAPPEMQPVNADDGTAEGAGTSAPSYPWDAGEDY